MVANNPEFELGLGRSAWKHVTVSRLFLLLHLIIFPVLHLFSQEELQINQTIPLVKQI